MCFSFSTLFCHKKKRGCLSKMYADCQQGGGGLTKVSADCQQGGSQIAKFGVSWYMDDRKVYWCSQLRFPLRKYQYKVIFFLRCVCVLDLCCVGWPSWLRSAHQLIWSTIAVSRSCYICGTSNCWLALRLDWKLWHFIYCNGYFDSFQWWHAICFALCSEEKCKKNSKQGLSSRHSSKHSLVTKPNLGMTFVFLETCLRHTVQNEWISWWQRYTLISMSCWQ